jgi:site-specific recombinase XerD
VRGAPTLAEFGRSHLATLDVEESTYRQNLGTFNTEIRKHFGEQIEVHEVTKQDVQDMLSKARNRGCGPSGRREKLNVLRKIMKAAVDEGLRDDDPTSTIPTPVVPRKKARILTIAEIEAIRAAMPPWLGIAVLLMAFAGLRIGEVCGLQVHNVDFVNNEITVQHVITKGGKLRPYPKGKEILVVPMGPDLRTALLLHIEKYANSSEGFVLWNPKHNVLVRPESLRRYFYKAIKKAEIKGPHVTPHFLRNFCATYLARNGAQAYDIQAILRHKNLITSQHYIDDVPGSDRVALASLFALPEKALPDAEAQAESVGCRAAG